MTAHEHLEDIPGFTIIGAGYNVFGKYADPESVRPQIFDFHSLPTREKTISGETYKIPQIMEVQIFDRSYYEKFSGKTINEFHTNLNVKAKLSYEAGVKKVEYFKGEIEGSFTSDTISNSEYEFVTINANTLRWYLEISADTEALIPLIKSHIKTKLESGNIDELFTTVGTHFLVQIQVGGRLRVASSVKKSHKAWKTDIEAAATGEYEDVTQTAKGTVSAALKSDIAMFKENAHYKIEAIGGDSALVIDSKDSYQKWAATIQANPRFMDFVTYSVGPTPSLVPIWDLIEDPTRKNQVKRAFAKYADVFSNTIDTGLLYNTPIVIRNGKYDQLYGAWASPSSTQVVLDSSYGGRDQWVIQPISRPGSTAHVKTMTDVRIKYANGDLYLTNTGKFNRPGLARSASGASSFRIKNAGRGNQRDKKEYVRPGAGYLIQGIGSGDCYLSVLEQSGYFPSYTPTVWSNSGLSFLFPQG